MNKKQKWLFFSAIGLLKIGLGISIIGEAIALKMTDDDFAMWFGVGTIGLIIFNGGIVFFEEAVKYATLISLERQKSSE